MVTAGSKQNLIPESKLVESFDRIGKQKEKGCKAEFLKTDLSGFSKANLNQPLVARKMQRKCWQQQYQAGFDTGCNCNRVVRKEWKTRKKLVAKLTSEQQSTPAAVQRN